MTQDQINLSPLEILKGFCSEPSVERGRQAIEAAVARAPRLAKGVAALVLRRLDDNEIHALCNQNGMGTIDAREQATRIQMQVRSTHLTPEEFDIACIILDELISKNTPDVCGDVKRQTRQRLTLDMAAILIARAEKDSWSRTRLRRLCFCWDGQPAKLEGGLADLPWLMPRVESAVGPLEFSYPVSLAVNTRAALTKPDGSVGVMLLASLIIVACLTVIFCVRSVSATTEPKSVVSAESKTPPANAAPVPKSGMFLQQAGEKLKEFAAKHEGVAIQILPSLLEEELGQLLTLHAPSTQVHGPASLHALGVSQAPARNDWILPLLPKIGFTPSDPKVPMRTLVAQLRIDGLGRPVLEVSDPSRGQVFLLFLGKLEDSKELLQGRTWMPLSVDFCLWQAEKALEFSSNERIDLWISLAKSAAIRDADQARIFALEAKHLDRQKQGAGDDARRLSELYQKLAMEGTK